MYMSVYFYLNKIPLMIPFMGETVCRAFNFVFIPVFLLLLFLSSNFVIEHFRSTDSHTVSVYTYNYI